MATFIFARDTLGTQVMPRCKRNDFNVTNNDFEMAGGNVACDGLHCRNGYWILGLVVPIEGIGHGVHNRWHYEQMLDHLGQLLHMGSACETDWHSKSVPLPTWWRDVSPGANEGRRQYQ